MHYSCRTPTQSQRRSLTHPWSPIVSAPPQQIARIELGTHKRLDLTTRVADHWGMTTIAAVELFVSKLTPAGRVEGFLALQRSTYNIELALSVIWGCQSKSCWLIGRALDNRHSFAAIVMNLAVWAEI